ncbi:MAG: 16S rRNA (uracil(1498)-N(3))-methyltransferase [Candidatus Omnitrophota bacterium]|nr:16S rRNA (uracil(1498)-N(3))-methyltransferase [Candidatus Omnitrophota bacterium]
MSRFYVSPESVKGKKIHIGKEESHHIIDVMRLAEGDDVTVFDGTGKEYSGKIESVKNKNVVINVSQVGTGAGKRPVEISLAQALPKKDKMDYIVQKATELGVREIIPVETERTIVRAPKDRVAHKTERWCKIAVEAAKQCGRSDLPDIKEPRRFNALVEDFRRYDGVIMPCLTDRTIPLKNAINKLKDAKKILLMIGPEGDFTPAEITRAEESGALLVSLGGLVLRSDTAAVATLAMLNYAYSI